MEKAKRNQNIGIVIGIALGFTLSGFLVQRFILNTPSFEKVMVQGASEINKSCPMMVDKETRMDNAVAMPGNIFQYNYTLINYDRTSIDTSILKQSIEPVILNNIKTNPQMKQFREHKTTLAYNYVDRNGVFVVRILATPERYN